MQQTHLAAIRTGIQMGLFKSLDDGNGNCVSTTELAKSTHADPQLLGGSLSRVISKGRDTGDLGLTCTSSNQLDY